MSPLVYTENTLTILPPPFTLALPRSRSHQTDFIGPPAGCSGFFLRLRAHGAIGFRNKRTTQER
jgi:hypothetical protein